MQIDMVTVSFTGAIIAHEKMGVFAYIDIGETVLKCLIALMLTLSLGRLDKLVVYAALLLAINLSKQMFSRVYAMRHFEECRIRWFWDKKTFLNLFGYAGWSFLGKTSGTFAGQGVTMVINVVFGPAVNAARSLAGTVNHAVAIFVNNFTMAINPQVTQSYAAGDTDYMKSLIFRGTKFTYFIMWIIALPLILETEFVTDLWLEEIPAYTISFIRLSLIMNTLNVLEVILAMGIRSTGRIMWYQLSFSFLEFLTFFASFILLHHGFSPEWSYYIGIIIVCLKTLTMCVLSKYQLDLSIREFLLSVVIPLILVSVISAIVPVSLFFVMSPGWLRFLAVLSTSIAAVMASSLLIGCSPSERKLLISMVMAKLK